MKKYLKNYLWAIGLIFLTQIAMGATDCGSQICRYVRAGAGGDGSDWSRAYSSLPANLVRGTTYFIADGTYPGRVFNDPTSGSTLITIKKATVSDHGTGVGWSNSYGDEQASFTGGFDFESSNYLIDGQTGGGAANNWSQNFGFKITEKSDAEAILKVSFDRSADNITIRHVDLQGKGSVSSQGGSYSNDGLAVYGASNITLSGFRMTGVGRGPFFLSGQNIVIEHGWVVSFFGSAAVHSEVASIWNFAGNFGDVTFRYNLFTDIQSTGGIMWDNSSNRNAKLLVYGNVFYKPAGANWGRANGVIGGWTGGSGEEFHNAIVYNNTFINVDQEVFSTLPNIASGNMAYNNLFYNCQSPNFAKFSSHDYNHFINSGGTHSETNGTSASSGNPFVNFTGLDFRLIAATSRGMSVPSSMQIDPLGVTRGSDGVLDRGAYEFGGTAPAPISEPTPTPTPTPEPEPTPTPEPEPTPTPVPATGENLLGSKTPETLKNSDGSSVNYELGMRFTSTLDGKIKAIRFYKSPSETGTHTGKIYSSSGALLASVVFQNETSSGWQSQNLATALSIKANTEYTVSVNTGNTYYVATNQGMSSQISSGHLKSVVGSNGVYGPIGSRPTSSWQDSNYFRDIVFEAASISAPAPTPAPAPQPTTWTLCSQEWGYCSFSGTLQVRYGANGQYVIKTFSNGVDCNNSVFGDPAPGITKACEISAVTVAPAPAPSTALLISNGQATHDTSFAYFKYDYANATRFQVLIDTDQTSSSGYSVSGTGADLLIENSILYKYAGTGKSWKWTKIGSIAQFTKSNGKALHKLSLSSLGTLRTSGKSVNLIYRVSNSTETKTLPKLVHSYSN